MSTIASEIAEAVNDVGDWVWGLIQGNFNEQQTISQLLVDAVIGMIPIVGDVTAVRDLIAVVLKLIEHPEKREEVMEWVTLVVLCFALIPVAGGVIKGVGKLVMRAGKNAAEHPKLVKAIIEVINRFGHGNAVTWFKKLELTQYTAQIKGKFAELLFRLDGVLHGVARKFDWVLPDTMLQRMQQLRDGIAALRKLADRMIPQAIKDLSERLKLLQKQLYEGEWVPVPSSLKSSSREAEARIVETLKDPRDTPMWKTMPFPPTPKEDYVHKLGWPDLDKIKNGDVIPTFSGPIKPLDLKEGTKIYRVLTTGKPGDNAGLFWILEKDLPKSGPEWRKTFAVLDDWNTDGTIIEMTVPVGGLRAWSGKVASQIDNTATSATKGQYLEGGANQLVVDWWGFPDKQFVEAFKKVAHDGKPVVLHGEHVTATVVARDTNWTGLMGINVPSKQADALRLGAHEAASKHGTTAHTLRGAVKASRPDDEADKK